MFRRMTNRLAAWMAMFAILFAFFAPTVSKAMSVGDHANVIYQKVCSEQGTKIVPLEMPAGQHSGGMAVHLGHCALCCSASHAPVISAGLNLFEPSNQQVSQGFASLYIAPAIKFHQQLTHPPQAPPVI
jgi:Protein of unknown function (DUF2946)